MKTKAVTDEKISWVEDIPFLEEDLREKLREYNLPESVIKGLTYSLCNCQGDGVGFHSGTFNLSEAKELLGGDLDLRRFGGLDVTFKIYTNRYANHYSHKGTFDVVHIATEYTNHQYSISGEVSEQLKEKLDEICDILEKYGYDHIESYTQDEILRIGFQKFLKLNNIESDSEHYDYDYSEEPEEGYTHIINICNYDFYMKLPQIREKTIEVKINYFDEDNDNQENGTKNYTG